LILEAGSQERIEAGNQESRSKKAPTELSFGAFLFILFLGS